MANPYPVQCICMLPGENTRGGLQNTVLPTIAGRTFCKRWHLGMPYFTRWGRTTSHVHTPVVPVHIIVTALVATVVVVASE